MMKERKRKGLLISVFLGSLLFGFLLIWKIGGVCVFFFQNEDAERVFVF